MNLDELYKDTILYHGKNTENRREVSPYDFKKRGVNHSCGDEITISMRVRDGVIDDIAFIGDGCMISMASTSIMIDLVKGKEVEEAKRIVDIFIKMIRMEAIEYEKRNTVNKRMKNGVLGYTLGLIGSILSGMTAFFMGIFIILFGKLVKDIIISIIAEILMEFEILNFLQIAEEFYNSSFNISILIFIIIFVGFILAISGTIMSWNNSSVLSCVIMIIGGIISLIPFLIPGIIIIIGGSVNLYDYIRYKAS